MLCCRRLSVTTKLLNFGCVCANFKLHQINGITYSILRLPNPIATSICDQLWNRNSIRTLPTIPNQHETVDALMFEKVCEETLESLSEYFEEIIENAVHLESADVSYSNGVLTVNFGPQYGVYVINRQSPNRQIWLSSPTSGPKRYDYIINRKCWIYRHDGNSLHQLLHKEIEKIVRNTVDFSQCLHS